MQDTELTKVIGSGAFQSQSTFVSTHSSWVEARTSYFQRQLRTPASDIRQAVWEGLLRASMLYIPGEQSLYTWAYRYVLQALSLSRLGIQTAASVPETTIRRYRKVLSAANGDIWKALDLAASGRYHISVSTVHSVHMALQPPMEMTDYLRLEDQGEL